MIKYTFLNIEPSEWGELDLHFSDKSVTNNTQPQTNYLMSLSLKLIFLVKWKL
jgi:hypothetical protein